MWELLKGMKGRKFHFGDKTLWHEIEKTPEERAVSIQTSKAINAIRACALEKGRCTEDTKKTVIDGDWTLGYVFFVAPSDKITRLVERNRVTKAWVVCKDAKADFPEFDFDDLVVKIVEKK